MEPQRLNFCPFMITQENRTARDLLKIPHYVKVARDDFPNEEGCWVLVSLSRGNRSHSLVDGLLPNGYHSVQILENKPSHQ